MLALKNKPRTASNRSWGDAGSLVVMPGQLNFCLHFIIVVVTSDDVGNLYAEPAFGVVIS